MFETKLFVCKLIQKRSGLTDEKATPTHTDTKNENHLMDVHQVSSRDDFKGPSKNYVTARGGRESTILLHIVTYTSGVRGDFMK